MDLPSETSELTRGDCVAPLILPNVTPWHAIYAISAIVAKLSHPYLVGVTFGKIIGALTSFVLVPGVPALEKQRFHPRLSCDVPLGLP